MKALSSFITKASLCKRLLVLIPSCVSFILCAVVLMNLEVPPGLGGTDSKSTADSTPEVRLARPRALLPELKRPPLSLPPPVALSVGAWTPSVDDADWSYLRSKKLLIPVAGVATDQLHDSFLDSRSEGRIHHAIDIKASQGAEVLATTDGKLKLHESARGGIMIYQTDSSGPYVYYYGHLQGYADGVYEGKSAKRGEVIGYVGDTGNAGAGNYHLHFGISKVSAPGKWSGGEAINPYDLLAPVGDY